jgi:DNA-binding protein HU-beta
MNKSQLIERVYEEYGKKISDKKDQLLTKKEIADTVNLTFDTMAKLLCDGNNITLTGFGTFRLKLNKPREVTNNSTGRVTQVPYTMRLGFGGCKKLKDRIDSTYKKSERWEADQAKIFQKAAEALIQKAAEAPDKEPVLA